MFWSQNAVWFMWWICIESIKPISSRKYIGTQMSIFTWKVLPRKHEMPILHRDNCYILMGRILLFVWDAHFYVGMCTLIVKTGKISVVCMGCLFSQRDAHIYCENRHPDAYIYVNIGIGVPIFAWNWASGMPIFGGAYFHLTPEKAWVSRLGSYLYRWVALFLAVCTAKGLC